MSYSFNTKSLNQAEERLPKDSPYYTNKTLTTTADKIQVTDADSFTLFSDSFRGSTRLYGVDAPETSIYEKAGAKGHKERSKVKREYIQSKKETGRSLDKMYELGQDYGVESTSIAKEFINNAVELHVNLKQMDAGGGRRVVEVFNQDGESLATHLVAEGAAFAELPSDVNFDGSPEAFERYELMMEAYQQGKGIFAEDDFVLPSSFRKGNLTEHYKKRLDTQLKVDEFKSRGIGNNQYAYTLADDDTYFTLPASLGASYFHGANLEHNLMEQNNYSNLARPTHYKGLAEGMMEYNHYMLEGKELGTFERFVARAYDSGLQAGGVGNWLNREIFIPRGWGRVYKDEKGAVASIAGLAGKILDESYMYYANLNPDWALIGKDYKEGVGYGALEDPQQGIFQTVFENTASFAESMAQSLGMYLAITAPMEMATAGLAKNYMDATIKGTMLDNTRLNALDPFDQTTRPGVFKSGRQPGFMQRFMAEFFLGDMGYQVQARPGGMTAAMLEQRFALDDDNIANKSNKAFFDHNDGPKSGMHAMQIIQRGRARVMLKGTFKPFLMDIINPFDGTLKADRWIHDPVSPSGKRQGNAFDEFNLRVNRLIDVVSQPVDLKIDIIKGNSVQFQSVTMEPDDQAEEVLTAAKEKVGKVTVRLGKNKNQSIQNYEQLKTQYQQQAKAIDTQMIDNNEKLMRILTNEKGANLTEQQAREYVFKKKKPPSLNLSIEEEKEVARRLDNKDQFVSAKNSIRSQLGSYGEMLETYTTNTGMAQKTAIAAAVQDVMDMIPLNPMKWGLSAGTAGDVKDFMSIGELFSFKHASEFTQQVLTGETKMTKVFLEFEPAVPDQVVDGKFLTKAEHISNVAKARMQQTDRILGSTWDSIKKFFTGESRSNGPNIDATTKRMRKAERAIYKAAEAINQDAVVTATVQKGMTGVKSAVKKVKAFNFLMSNVGNVAQNTAEVVVGDIGEESVQLLQEVLDYSHEVRKAGGISIEQMTGAMKRAGLENVAGEVMDVTNKFSGNIKAEKFLGGTTGYIAGAIFISLALNNIMQSTSGVSIVSQIGMSLYGEDEDIAVAFEGNRYLPTELIAAGFGLNQTAVNLVADTVAIAGVVGIGHHIAKNIKSEGYLPYTFDEETIYRMSEDTRFKFVDKKGKEMVGKASFDKLTTTGHDTFVTLTQDTGKVDNTGKAILKKTVLTRTAAGFMTEPIMQSFAKNVPTKTFIFGSIALLALEGTRKAAGTLLQAMAESPDDKNFGGMAAGMIGGSFAMGAFMTPMLRPKPSANVGQAVAEAGGFIRSSSNIARGLRGGAAWAIGGAALASAIYVGKLVMDPDIEQKGSLDPIVAGAAFGIGVGIWKKSAAFAGVAGIAALSTMAAINWAGIRFLEVGRAGTSVDPHTAKLVSQLSQFSTAVLEGEKDSVMFHVMMAAYAGQFSAGKSILAEDPKAVAGEVQVVAKQSPLPFLQFFVAERVKGPRGSGLQNGGPDNEKTIRSYSLGIQSGALFGTSMSVELPVTYTPGEGFFGFTYNSENNLMAVPNFAMKVGVWAAAATGGVGIAYNLGAALNMAAYNMTGQKFNALKEGAEDFTRHADDLFEAGKFMLGSAEKISTFFIRHTMGIFSTLQGTDARMAYETYKNSATKVQSAADKLNDHSINIKDISLMDEGADTFDDVSNVQKGWKQLTDGHLGRKVLRGRHLAAGVIIGSIAASMVHEVVKDRILASTYEAGASYETIASVEEEAEKRRILYIAVGGAAGGIINDVRTGMGFIKGFAGGVKSSPLRSAYKTLLASDSVKKTRVAARARLAVMKIRKSSIAKAFQSRVLNNQISKGIGRTVSGIMSRKTGRLGLVFAAAAAFSYIKTNSKFGIATMMDRQIKYDKRGNAYDDYELQTESAHLHQLGVVGLTAAYHTAIIGVVAMPHLSLRETMLKSVRRKIDGLNQTADVNFFKKMVRKSGAAVTGIFYARAERETGALLRNLTTLDREAEVYAEFAKARDEYAALVEEAKVKGGTVPGKAPTLDPKLQKIEDVLALRHSLGKKELNEYLALEKKRRGLVSVGQTLDVDEEKIYRGFLDKLDDSLSQSKNLKNLGKGFGRTFKFGTFSRRATAVITVAALLGGVIRTVGNQGGAVGEDSYLDRLYNKANEGARLGQRRPDGKMGTLAQGAWHILADFARLITNRDVVDLNYAVDSLNGKMVRTNGQRLVSNSKGVSEAQNTIAQLSEMAIFDNPNAYIATFDFGGRTLRQGDKGVTTSSYFQLQGPAQDISTATYSMAAKFIFNKYTAGKGRLATIIDRGMRDFDPNDPASFDKAGLTIRNATGMLDAMKTSRKYSRATAETAATFAGDSMVSAIIAKRNYALAEQAWQPVDSLFTNMFFETIDKAKHRGQDNALVGFLQNLAKNEQDVMQIFSDLMAGGLFENFFRRTAISNVKFFSGSFGKPPKKSGPQHMVADISALWHQTHDLTVQAEMFHQSRVAIFDEFVDKVASPMFNHSVMALLPDWIKIGGVATVGVGLTAAMAYSFAKLEQIKSASESTGEMLQVFGRKDSVGTTSLNVAPQDINEIKKQVRRHVQNGGRMKWEADTKVSTDKVLVMKGKEAGASADLRARNQIIMNVSQAGKKEMLMFEMSTYTNHFSPEQWDEFIHIVQNKGDHIAGLFNYVDEATKSKMNIVHALTNDGQVQKWLEKIGLDPKSNSIYDVFNGSHPQVSRDAFIAAGVEDVQAKFTQGLDTMYDLTEGLDPKGTMLQEITIMIDGEPRTFLAGELMDPNNKIDVLESQYGKIDGGDTSGLDARRKALQSNYQGARQKFLDKIELIVADEMKQMPFDPKNMKPEDQIAAVKEAKRRALNRIKVEVADAGTEMGQVARGLGIVSSKTLVDEKAAKQAASQGVKSKITKEGEKFFEDSIEPVQFRRPKVSTGFWDSLGVAGKGMMTAGFTIMDILQGGDLIGSYLRMAESLSSPYASNLDVAMAEKELGRAILTSALGLMMGHFLGKLTGLLGNEGVRTALKNPMLWVKGGAIALAGGLATAALSKKVIAPGLRKFNKYMKNSKVGSTIKGAWDDVWFTTADAVGHLAAQPVKLGHRLAGERGAYAAAGFLGGAGAGAVLGLGAMGAVKAVGLAAGMAVTGVGLLPLAVFALGMGIVFGVGAALGTKKATSGMNYMTREVLKIPFIGAMSGMTDPYRQIRSQERFKHHFVNSPFLLGYVGDIVNNNWLVTLSAAEDHTGRDQVANIFGEILSEGEGYESSHSAWRAQAAEGLIGGPKPIVDDVIQQELRIRGEFYSDNVIGRYSWDQLVQYSDNSGAIRGMEARNRAERIRIQEAARVKIMKAAMEGGGPRQAMTTGSARKAAVVGVAAARVEQVYKDLDTDTSSIKVTKAKITTHKSSVKNSDQAQEETVKQLTVSPDASSVPITLESSYTARLYIDKTTAVVDYEKAPSDMNPILQQEAQVMTGGKAKTPEQKTQADTYNSHKDET